MLQVTHTEWENHATYALNCCPEQNRSPQIDGFLFGSRFVNAAVLPRGATWRRQSDQFHPQVSNDQDKDPGDYPAQCDQLPIDARGNQAPCPGTSCQTTTWMAEQYGVHNLRQSEQLLNTRQRWNTIQDFPTE